MLMMTIDDTGILLQSADFASYGKDDADTLEATPDDITRYAGKSAISLSDAILLALLKRVPQ
jgi:hypothetical protein